MRRTARRKTVLTAGLAAMVGVSAIGCKSMPSLAWWKTTKKNDVGATALAQSAPALPSDVAIKTEGLAAATAAPTGGMAAPFAASAAPSMGTITSGGSASGVTPASYPNTGIPAGYPTTSASNVAGNVPTNYPSTSPSSASAPPANYANMGSIAMPYNPNAVPPAATTASAPAAPAPSADRYATAPSPSLSTPSTPSMSTSSNMSASTASSGDAGSRYGAPTASTAAPAYNTSTAVSAPSYTADPIQSTPPAGAGSTSPTSAVGDRYAQASTTPAATTPPPTSNQTVSQTAATSQPYRPGGTGTYPGATEAEENLELAARPETSTTGTTNSVPNVATPGYIPAPTQTAPQVPRYW